MTAPAAHAASDRAAPAQNSTPVVWALLSDKGGDNAQVDAAIARLPWPVTRMRLHFKRLFIEAKPLSLASLYHVDKHRSDPLEPPWPDLLLTVGRRPAMAALWIRKQSREHTRIVLFGRPRRDPRHFALIVVSSQFSVRGIEHVVETTLPLMRLDEARLNEARASWQSEFDRLPRPLIAVLVGGATRPYVFGAAEATRVIAQAAPYAGKGTLYITTSRRTGADATAALRSAMPASARLWSWGDATPNPYLGLLASADGFVVTSDSMSMITEVARQKRPLAIYPLPLRPLTQWLRRHLPASLIDMPNRVVYNGLPRLGITVFRRDLTEIPRQLIAHRLAVAVGDPFPADPGELHDDIQSVVDAIVDLIN